MKAKTWLLLFVFIVPITTTGAWENNRHLWSAPWSWTGPMDEAKFGLSVASGGDLNGDGVDDLVLSAPFDATGGTELGTIFVVFGSASGFQPELNITSSAVASYRGEAFGDHPGGSTEGGAAGVTIVPSMNGDIYDDLVIASPDNDEAGVDAGKVYIIFGKATGWPMDDPLSNADASFVGEAADNKVGTVVASAGDVNGDGKGDLLIGAPMAGSGKVYLILGKSTGWGTSVSLSTADASFIGEVDQFNLSRAGFSVSGIPDLNDDDCDEILIGAPKFTPDFDHMFLGKAYLILGKSTGWAVNDTLSDPAVVDVSFIGTAAGDEVGTGVSSAGDTDNDGKGDLLISSPVGTGNAYLFLGDDLTIPGSDILMSSAQTHIVGADNSLGAAMASLGDANNDGYDDFAVGAPFYDAGPGKVYAVFGRASWPAELQIENAEGGWKGTSGKFWAGGSVSGGDVNNDGLADLVVGAGADPTGGYDSGGAYVILSNYGADTTPPARTTDLDAEYNVSGQPTLEWSQVTLDDNGGPEDVLFYRVLRYRHRYTDTPRTFVKHLPAVINPVTTVQDTAHVIGDVDNHYYYRLFTVDDSGNVSELSTGTGEIDFLTSDP